MPKKDDFALLARAWVLDIPWPDWRRDFAGRPDGRVAYKAAQDEYFAKTRREDQAVSLDVADGGRSNFWKKLWKERDRIEDCVALQRGNKTKRLERELELMGKKVKREVEGANDEYYTLPLPGDELLQTAGQKWHAMQESALRCWLAQNPICGAERCVRDLAIHS